MPNTEDFCPARVYRNSNLEEFKMKKVSIVLAAVFFLTVFNLASAGQTLTAKTASAQMSGGEALPVGNYGMATTSDGKYIYAFNGSEPTKISATALRYNSESKKWERWLENLIPKRYANAEFVAGQNKIYVFNGERSGKYRNVVEVVGADGTIAQSNVKNPSPSRYAGSAVWENKIYVFGGSTDNEKNYSKRLSVFDPADSSWKQLAEMPEGKETDGEIVDGVLYVVGGWDGKASSKRIDAYDIETGKWSAVGVLPFGISAHRLRASGEKIWIAGSYNDKDTLAVFDTTTGEITVLTSNFAPRRHVGLEILNGELFVFGGNQAARDSHLTGLQILSVR